MGVDSRAEENAAVASRSCLFAKLVSVIRKPGRDDGRASEVVSLHPAQVYKCQIFPLPAWVVC